jgi:hypothetical protein
MLFDLYDRIIHNALGLQQLLRESKISLDVGQSDQFNQILLTLHEDAIQHTKEINELILNIANREQVIRGNERRQEGSRRHLPDRRVGGRHEERITYART